MTERGREHRPAERAQPVCTHDRGQDSPIHDADRPGSVNKMFLIWRKQEQVDSFNVTAFVVTDTLLVNDDEIKLILLKVDRLLYFFSDRGLFGTSVNIVR